MIENLSDERALVALLGLKYHRYDGEPQWDTKVRDLAQRFDKVDTCEAARIARLGLRATLLRPDGEFNVKIATASSMAPIMPLKAERITEIVEYAIMLVIQFAPRLEPELLQTITTTA